MNLVLYDAHTDLYQALQALNENSMDILFVFLGENETDISNFEMLEPHFYRNIIVISENINWAAKLFGTELRGFLRYPLEELTLYNCIKKFREDHAIRVKEAFDEFREDVLMINRHDRSFFLHVSQIVRLEAMGSYTDFYLENGSKISASKNLMYYEKLLAKHKFYKVHRSHIVALDKVKELIKYEGDGVVILSDGTRVNISRSRKNEFIRKLLPVS